MQEVEQLLLSNRAWAAEMLAENPEFFSRNVNWQRPATCGSAVRTAGSRPIR